MRAWIVFIVGLIGVEGFLPLRDLRRPIGTLRLSQPDDGFRGPDLESFGSLFQGNKSIQTGDTVIVGQDNPNYNLYKDKPYELQQVYFQGEKGNRVVRLPVDSLHDPTPAEGQGFDKYIVLYNPEYQSEPVIVRPDEVVLGTVKDLLTESVWLALPGFFWVFVAWQFYQYGVRMGRL